MLFFFSPESANSMLAINRKPVSLLPKIVLLLLWLAGSIYLYADSISGTIADPSGALIPGARRPCRAARTFIEYLGQFFFPGSKTRYLHFEGNSRRL